MGKAVRERKKKKNIWRKKTRGGLHFYHHEKHFDKKIFSSIAYWIFWGLAMVLLAFAFVYLLGIRTSVIGVSMEPTLYNGQEVLIDRFSYFFVTPAQNDVVVFRPNGNENMHYYIKRVIAVPGDTIQIKSGEIYINGEIYLESVKYDKMEDGGIAENEITLGEDEYFVLGDNRNNSEDSRSSNVGIVDQSYIIGKAWFQLGSDDVQPGFIK